ncbi:hypothetical protein [Olivibacter domesticus]|uniref:Outer membrane protein beta-barrel domain-containing protein n=1 Tax=Olivibacter domesticus TaxID=407022 RepID=A0A1H7U4W3_OLID1|nr:hypothetical protein [Olivibacter domesticus]SEL92110.1 hypothetical protein SAMN05661044_03740 [Olivibacter domesticus]
MRKGFLPLLAVFLLVFLAQESKAQYRTALGLGIDLGDGRTLVGPQLKHFFSANDAGNVQVLFADNNVLLGADYSYNQAIRGARGLNWYIGVGPQLNFVDHGPFGNKTYFAIRPALGLEYKVPSAPLAFHFDWKPWWNLTDESNFEASRFSIGFKYTFN